MTSRFPRPAPAALLMLGLCIATSLGARAFGQAPDIPERPAARIAGPAHGFAAVRSLGNLLPAVAARYGTTAEELAQRFSREADLWTDGHTRLLYRCSGMVVARNARIQAVAGAPPFPTSQTFLLHSRPTSTRKLYLDFDGYTTSNTPWNDPGTSFTSTAFDLDGDAGTFSTAEQEEIQRTWQRVSEDYAPFDIDVTTQDPGVEALRKSGSFDNAYGIRVVISPTTSWIDPAPGGIAFIGSFDWDADVPCFVFQHQVGDSEKGMGEAASHEVGHTLGLNHDGTTGTNGVEYYAGQGQWAPIMGVGYYVPITQFSKGEYANANNKEDDLAVMATHGGIARTDDAGDSIAAARPLDGDNPSFDGDIEETSDVDFFQFQTGAGAVTLAATPASWAPNLDIRLDLYDSGGTLKQTMDGSGLNATISTTLAAGVYYLKVDGVGSGDPLTTGYSDYASLGQYHLALTLQTSVNTPTNLTAAGTSQTAISLQWQDQSSNETGFEIQAGSVDGQFSALATVGAGTTTYTHTGLTKNTQRYYRVRAVSGPVPSAWSNTASATTLPDPPAAPSSLQAAAVTADRVDLQWQDGSTNEADFVIERANGGAFAPVGTAPANTPAFSDTTVDGGTTYQYRVRARNAAGTSDPAGSIEVTTPQAPPGAPTLTAVTASAADTIAIGWQAGAGVTDGFRLERKSTGDWEPVQALLASDRGFTDTGLSANTSYVYRMQAFGPGGDSGWSSPLSALTYPAAPTNLAAAAGGGQAHLTWDHSGACTGFRVFRKGSSGSFVMVGQLGSDARDYTDGALAPGATLNYQVKAYNSAGESSAVTTTVTILPRVVKLTLSPGSARGGATVKGTVTLAASAPAGGAVVALSSNSASVVVPATAKIAAGKTTGTFTFKPRKVKKTTKAQVSAAYGGATVTAAFTVKK